MIVDGKGNIFENRRKKDRRKNEFDAEGGRRADNRRKAPPQQTIPVKKRKI